VGKTVRGDVRGYFKVMLASMAERKTGEKRQQGVGRRGEKKIFREGGFLLTVKKDIK